MSYFDTPISGNGGALNPQLADGELIKLLSAPFGRYRCMIFSLSRSLNAAFRPDQFYQKGKARAMHRLFLFGGNGGARTRDLTDVNRAL